MPLNDLTCHQSVHPRGGASFSIWKANALAQHPLIEAVARAAETSLANRSWAREALEEQTIFAVLHAVLSEVCLHLDVNQSPTRTASGGFNGTPQPALRAAKKILSEPWKIERSVTCGVGSHGQYLREPGGSAHNNNRATPTE